LTVKILLQHKGEKQHFFKGVKSVKPCIDLIVVDMPEGLPYPDLFVPSSSIPKWNADNPLWLEAVFEFANGHLHDNGALIILYPLRAVTKANIMAYSTTYSFEKMKDWWGMNWLHLASPSSTSRMVTFFSISFFIGMDFLLTSYCQIKNPEMVYLMVV